MRLTYDLFANTMPPASRAALAAVEALAAQSGVEARGAVFTRREVVDFILDLAGYTPDKPLHEKRLLEPSFGGGDFLLPAVERLLAAWSIHGDGGSMFDALKNAIRAVELHRDTFQSTRRALVEYLKASDVGLQTANRLADAWLVQDDFLLVPLDGQFDYAVGNPPYVRQELIPEALMREYRARYATIYDRADLYIPFIERSLCMLAPGGALGFICADRWMKNRYGAPLRKLVAEQFHLKVYVDMDGSDAFHQEVAAYPAITVICREPSGPTRIGHCFEISAVSLAKLAALLDFSLPLVDSAEVREMRDVAAGEAPWLIESSDQLALLRRLERLFPLLEEAGCKVGIGVATGADKVFIGDYAALDVEPECKLPLVTTRDIQSGEMQWRGLGVINPFGNGDGLVDLSAYPRLQRYLEQHKAQILQRHCAQKNPAGWYRTIDRIFPALSNRPKLLIPDIKGEAHIVYEAGKLYPHHNLYFVTSDTWDLRALQAVLLSSISRLFVAIYSTKIHLERAVLTLPGYFRPTKLWDLLVIHQGELIAAIELKSHVGPSFGNNFNNRAEESIGTAHDFWAAYREGAFGKQPRPFAGWLMLVEDAPRSRSPVKDKPPHFPVSAEFQNASYLKRYDVLCQRLMQEQLYSSAAVIASPREALTTGKFSDLSEYDQLENICQFAGGACGGAGEPVAREFLSNEGECPIFVNADLIAAGLSPFAPELAAFKAGRLMLEEIASHVKRDESFAFETTLSPKISPERSSAPSPCDIFGMPASGRARRRAIQRQDISPARPGFPAHPPHAPRREQGIYSSVGTRTARVLTFRQRRLQL